MTIYDAAPALLGIPLMIVGTTLCLVEHRRVVARREARRAASQRQVAAE